MRKSILLLAFYFGNVYSHGILTDPRQRGALRLDNHLVPTVDWNAPTDYQGHYPAGSKSDTPGAGTASLRRAAGNYWTPHDPLNPSNRWRAGVCGDELGGPQDHLKGGKYYHDAYRVREYVQGSIIFMEAEIVTHHNGYFEFYICNIDTCGDDISVKCFHEGHCRQLMRTPGPCDAGDHQGCGPIDKMNPGRWYLPCRKTEPMMIGGWSRTIAYTLPQDLVCDHCVIHWYWTSANTCNPPGVREYFTSPSAPQWGTCEGQGGAVGGWPARKGTCGGSEFPEEYFQCSDIRIIRNRHLGHHDPMHHPPRPSSHKTPSPSPSFMHSSEEPQPMTEAGLHPDNGFTGSSNSDPSHSEHEDERHRHGGNHEDHHDNRDHESDSEGHRFHPGDHHGHRNHDNSPDSNGRGSSVTLNNGVSNGFHGSSGSTSGGAQNSHNRRRHHKRRSAHSWLF